MEARNFKRIWATVGVLLFTASLVSGHQAVPVEMTAYAASRPEQSIRLPIYPHASKQSYATIKYGTSTSPYLKAGSARYVVRAKLDGVTSWYRSVMPRRGYRLQSNHSGVGSNATGWELEFVSKHNPGITVELDFSTLPNKPYDTVIRYTVTNLLLPPRPANSFIPSNVDKVIVDYQPASTSGGLPTVKRTFTKRSILRELVQAVNALPEDIRSSVYGATVYHGGATLKFLDSRHHFVVVKVEMGVNRVVVRNTKPLFDLQNDVWQLVSSDMGFAPYPPRG